MMAFLKEVQYSHPPTFIKKLAWDFPLVLVTLQAPPYEPTQDSKLKLVSLRIIFLLSLVVRTHWWPPLQVHLLSQKKLGDLASTVRSHSPGNSWMQWHSNQHHQHLLSHLGMTLWLTLGLLCKGMLPYHQCRALLLCPACVLWCFLGWTAAFLSLDQVFTCHIGKTEWSLTQEILDVGHHYCGLYIDRLEAQPLPLHATLQYVKYLLLMGIS